MDLRAQPVRSQKCFCDRLSLRYPVRLLRYRKKTSSVQTGACIFSPITPTEHSLRYVEEQKVGKDHARLSIVRQFLHPARRRRKGGVLNAGGGGGLAKKKGAPARGEPGEVDTPGKKILVGIAFLYLGVILFLPAVNVFYQAFKNGLGPFLFHLTDPDFLQAVKMTLLLTIVAVPINTVVGITAAINITRNEFPGKTLLIAMLDLPFSISPVVTGLMLVLLYGREGWFAPILRATGFNIVFAFPGMALATLFVTMPFVVRELIPVLESMDFSEEEAALTLGASKREVFWNVTLPNIRWGLMYGILLTNARAMGEFGAVSVISGNIIGRTQTLTLFVESAYKEYNTEGAFSAAVLLSIMAIATIVVKEWLEKQHLSEK